MSSALSALAPREVGEKDRVASKGEEKGTGNTIKLSNKYHNTESCSSTAQKGQKRSLKGHRTHKCPVFEVEMLTTPI